MRVALLDEFGMAVAYSPNDGNGLLVVSYIGTVSRTIRRLRVFKLFADVRNSIARLFMRGSYEVTLRPDTVFGHHIID